MSRVKRNNQLTLLEERARISLFHLREMYLSETDAEAADDLLAIISILEGDTDGLLGVGNSTSLQRSNRIKTAKGSPAHDSRASRGLHTGRPDVPVFTHKAMRAKVSGKRQPPTLKLISNNT